MTTLVCWCGVDSRGPSSINIATDSKFTWCHGKGWNRGRKLVVRSGGAEVLAFAGDVTFVQNLMLGLPVGAITDEGLHDRLNQLSEHYPGSNLTGTAVVFLRRIAEGMASTFVVTSHAFANDGWAVAEHAVDCEQSSIVCAFGSGRAYAIDEVKQWMEGDASGRTSRSVFSGFCDALRAKKDLHTSEPPQLACIRRSGPAQEVGLVWNDQLFVSGLVPSQDFDIDSIEWFNDLFERCDPRTRQRLASAQTHARPRSRSRL